MISVGVIGYGYWGPNLVRNFSEIPRCTVTRVCDTRKERRDDVCARYRHIVATERHTDILEDPKVDAVVLATPVLTHYPLAKEALLRGKHVLVEKPLCTSLEEARELVALAARQKKALMVGHTFLYSPAVIKMKEIIDAGEIGDVYYIDSSRVNLGLFQPDVSVLWDLGPHDVSIVLYLLGKQPLRVSANGGAFVGRHVEEVCFMTLYFPDNVMAHFHLSWLSPSKLRRTTVIGSKKMIVYDDTEPAEKIKIYDHGVIKHPENFGEFQLTYRSGDILSPRLNTTEPLKTECLEFLNMIEHPGTSRSGGNNALDVVRVLGAAAVSLAHGGQRVDIAG